LLLQPNNRQAFIFPVCYKQVSTRFQIDAVACATANAQRRVQRRVQRSKSLGTFYTQTKVVLLKNRYSIIKNQENPENHLNLGII
jgi:hypothetical protein